MEQRLTLITIGVKDLDTMKKFYEEIFEWEPLENSNEQIVFFQLNGIQLALFGRDDLAEDAHISPEGNGFKGFALAYNVRSEQAVRSLFDHFKSRNVTILKSPQETSWGGFSGYISDPEGTLWEIAYNPFMNYDENGNVLP